VTKRDKIGDVAAKHSEITRVLMDMRRGDAAAVEQLLPLIYDELRALAASFLARQTPGHTLQPTALVHEAYIRIARKENPEWESRAHFNAVAARAMRQILINHHRDKVAAKRGGGIRRVTLDEAVTPAIGSEGELDLLDIDQALQKLGELSERQAHIVELRVFSGLTIAETAYVLGVGTTTIEDDWRLAKAWLALELREGPDE